MSIFNRKKIEKESNIAGTPENAKPKAEFSIAKFYYMLWFLFSMTFHICYVTYIIITIAQKNFLSQIIVYLLYGYAIALVLIILFSLGNKSKLKARLTNYKSAVNFLKYLIQMISFVLSLVTAISSFFTTGKFDSLAMSSALTSLLLTAIMAFFEFIKIMIRKNIPIVKQNFLRMKEHGDVEKLQVQTSKLQEQNEEQPASTSDDLNYNDNISSPLNYSQNDDLINKNQNESILIDLSEPEKTQNVPNITEKKNFFSKIFKKNKINLDQINELEKTDNQNELNNDNQNQVLSPVISEPTLSKNEKFDRDAGVIIAYDDDEDEEYQDIEPLDPAIARATRQSNKFSKIIKKFMKNK